jgi:Zn-dependent protease with chaperone function
MREQMLRLGEVDWRIRLAAGNLCPQMASGIGVVVDHAAAYASPDGSAFTRSLRMGKMPQVAVVAAGSPAAQAGVRPGDELVAIGDTAMADLLAASRDPSLFAEDVMELLAALPPGLPATLILQRGKASLRKKIAPVAVCASRTMLDSGRSLAAYSDSRDLAVTSALIEFTANDDELALIVGHELAHVLLPRAPGAQQQQESEADVFGARLAHCAGYDVARAADFWPRYRAQDLLARSRLPTHPSPERREEAIRAALPTFTCPVRLSAEEPPPSNRHRP